MRRYDAGKRLLKTLQLRCGQQKTFRDARTIKGQGFENHTNIRSNILTAQQIGRFLKQARNNEGAVASPEITRPQDLALYLDTENEI